MAELLGSAGSPPNVRSDKGHAKRGVAYRVAIPWNRLGRYVGTMQPTPVRKYQPLALRAWHWPDAVAVLGLLGTVLLRKTFLSWRTNAALIESTLQDAGITVPPDVAKAIAVDMRDRMWEWHHVLGFTLAGLLIVRVLVAVALPAERPWATAARALRAFSSAPPEGRFEAAHVAVVKVGYVVFYLCVLFMAISGLGMYFEDALGLGATLVDTTKELHEWAMWFFVAFASAHVLGVVVAEHRGSAGIVSDMIQGGDGSAGGH